MRKYYILMIVGVLFLSCQKEIETVDETPISVSSDKTQIILGSEERATITVTLIDPKPGTTIDLEVEGGTIDGKTSLTDLIPINGILIREFVSGTEAGTCYVTAKIHDSGFSSVIEIELVEGTSTSLPIDSVLILSLGQTGPFYADGLTSVDVIADVSNHEATEVTFTTSNGKFSNNAQTIVVPITSGQAITSLTVSNESVDHLVNASLTSPIYNRTITISTNPTLPESIFLTANSSVVDSSDVSQSSNNIELTAFLNRTNGMVSAGHSVNALAYQLPGGVQTSYGFFYNYPLVTGADEKVVCNFFTSPGLDKNLLLFIVFSTNGATGTISDTISLTVY